MKTFVRERWLHLPPRDRQLCGVLAVFLLIVFSVYGLWLPAQQRLDAARALYLKQLALEGEVGVVRISRTGMRLRCWAGSIVLNWKVQASKA